MGSVSGKQILTGTERSCVRVLPPLTSGRRATLLFGTTASVAKSIVAGSRLYRSVAALAHKVRSTSTMWRLLEGQGWIDPLSGPNSPATLALGILRTWAPSGGTNIPSFRLVRSRVPRHQEARLNDHSVPLYYSKAVPTRRQPRVSSPSFHSLGELFRHNHHVKPAYRDPGKNK